MRIVHLNTAEKVLAVVANVEQRGEVAGKIELAGEWISGTFEFMGGIEVGFYNTDILIGVISDRFNNLTHHEVSKIMLSN